MDVDLWMEKVELHDADYSLAEINLSTVTTPANWVPGQTRNEEAEPKCRLAGSSGE